MVLEVVLLAVTIPIGEMFGSPFAFGVDSRTRNPTIFFTAVPVACLVLGYVVARWATRPIVGHTWLHGLLLGAVATVLYFGLVSARPGGVALVAAEYGPRWFAVAQLLRIVGCAAGARRR